MTLWSMFTFHTDRILFTKGLVGDNESQRRIQLQLNTCSLVFCHVQKEPVHLLSVTVERECLNKLCVGQTRSTGRVRLRQEKHWLCRSLFHCTTWHMLANMYTYRVHIWYSHTPTHTGDAHMDVSSPVSIWRLSGEAEHLAAEHVDVYMSLCLYTRCFCCRLPSIDTQALTCW